MPISFPSSPNVNDTFTIGQRTWKWDGVTWTLISTLAAGPTGPTGPTGPQGPTGPTGPTGPSGTGGGGASSDELLTSSFFTQG